MAENAKDSRGVKMNVLSLFDGMSCGQLALKKAGIKYNNYYASEIKTHAIETVRHNFPQTIHVGDIHWVNGDQFPRIDLLIGGTPCQDLTSIKIGGKGLKGAKSGLFYEYLRLLEEVDPKYFLLENVASMKIEDRDTITRCMGVDPVFINSKDFSAQERRRLYWTNIPVDNWKDKGIRLRDIIDYGSKPEENMSEKKKSFIYRKMGGTRFVRVDGDKSMPITARGYQSWNTQFVHDNGSIRDLTLSEYKKLQTIPKEYEFQCIKSKATDLIGDGWTVDVIAHIFKGLA